MWKYLSLIKSSIFCFHDSTTSRPLCGVFGKTVRMSNMAWALDKQQAAKKYTQITVNGLPHQPLTHPTAHSLSPMPAFSRTLVKIVGQQLFGAAVAILETTEIIKCFIKLVTGPHSPRIRAALLTHFLFYWQIREKRINNNWQLQNARTKLAKSCRGQKAPQFVKLQIFAACVVVCPCVYVCVCLLLKSAFY